MADPERPPSPAKPEENGGGGDATTTAAAAPPPRPVTPAMLASIFYRILDHRLLDAVDVCEISKTCREMHDCGRRFWREAALSPSSQARRLLPAEGPGRCWVTVDEAVDCGGFENQDPPLPFFFSGDFGRDMVAGAINTRSLPPGEARRPCACCGSDRQPVHGFFFAPEQPVPCLCRTCYEMATDRGSSLSAAVVASTNATAADADGTTPAAAAAADNDPTTTTTTTTTPAKPLCLAHYRLAPLRDLALKYCTYLPFSMFDVAMRSLAPKTRRSKPLFLHTQPHGQVRRVAVLTLLTRTPVDLKAHWTVLGVAKRYFEADLRGGVAGAAAAGAVAAAGATPPPPLPPTAEWGGYFAHEEF